MPQTGDWAFPEQLQPPPEAGFDLQAALDSVVLLRATIAEDAFTAGTLGTERIGNGVVIREDGLVVTIGYLITEAESVWLTTNSGSVMAAHPLAYDQTSGLGLVLPLGRLEAPALPLGTSARAAAGDAVIVASQGGRAHALDARIVARREFAGYWEYLLDEALFTVPAHPHWSGAALLDGGGRLLGIGSLLTQHSVQGEALDANLFVPIDLLAPVLEELTAAGRPARRSPPWLGMYTTQVQDQLVISGLVEGGPAAQAGVRLGDIVLEVADQQVSGLAQMLRQVWRLGPIGTRVPLTLARGAARPRVTVRSADRNDFLKKPQRH